MIETVCLILLYFLLYNCNEKQRNATPKATDFSTLQQYFLSDILLNLSLTTAARFFPNLFEATNGTTILEFGIFQKLFFIKIVIKEKVFFGKWKILYI